MNVPNEILTAMKLYFTLKFFLKCSLMTAIFIFLLSLFLNINKTEASFEILIFISLVCGLINGTYLSILKLLGVTNFLAWPNWTKVLEIVLYYGFLSLIEGIFSRTHLAGKVFFDYPFTYVYPIILITVLIYLFKRYLITTRFFKPSRDK